MLARLSCFLRLPMPLRSRYTQGPFYLRKLNIAAALVPATAADRSCHFLAPSASIQDMPSPTVVKFCRVCVPITSVCLVQVSQDTVQAVAGEVADRVHERLGLFSPTPPPGPNVVTPAPTTAAGASTPSRSSLTTHRESFLGTTGVPCLWLNAEVAQAQTAVGLFDTVCVNTTLRATAAQATSG